jgi:hypothetical protein
MMIMPASQQTHNSAMLFEKVCDDVIVSVLVSWLDWGSIGYLDSSLVNSVLRPKFLSCLSKALKATTIESSLSTAPTLSLQKEMFEN